MIYIITHKQTQLPSIQNYIPLLVGAVNHPELAKYYSLDSTGNSISEKNDSYCELTGLYWMWKNTSHKYYGLVHYRRFFAEIHRLFKVRTVYYSIGKPSFRLYEEEELITFLGSSDMLVVESPKLPYGNRIVLQHAAGESVWDDLDELIQEQYPDYWQNYMQSCRNRNHIQCNMFFGRREIVDMYCNWIFPLLDSLDSLHFKKTGDRYHNRELGYIAELLFDVWIRKNNISYKVIDCITICNTKNDQHQIKRLWLLPRDLLRNIYLWLLYVRRTIFHGKTE